MKYSFELKKEIYDKHHEGYSNKSLSIKYGITESNIRHMCNLADKHGLGAIRHKHTYYSTECKLIAINRVLLNSESIRSVAVDIGLTTDSVLRQWIKSYIENGYNVVTKKKGRPSTRDQEKENSRRVGEGEQTPSRTTIEEDHRSRILKKIVCLNSRGRKE
ncbi:MAG: transposase, partial [Saccharofermentanaceae bacterium]|nr:transposase [Saccharofermentanaceae bacterium]